MSCQFSAQFDCNQRQVSWSLIREAMKSLIAVFTVFLLALGFKTVAAEQNARDSYLLGKAYLYASAAGMLAEMARAGITIHTPDATITSENADQFSTANEEKAARYAEAINLRGFQDVSGAYTGTATKACLKVQSMWATLIENGQVVKIEITQEGFEGLLRIATADAPDKMFDNRIAVVENSIALIDFLNSDYFFQGTISGDTIVLRPDPASLESWPDWISPPKRKNIDKCAVTLKRAF